MAEDVEFFTIVKRGDGEEKEDEVKSRISAAGNGLRK